MIDPDQRDRLEPYAAIERFAEDEGVSRMFQQLEPPIPVHILDKGAGFAIAVIDYGQEHNLIWVTAINETGEIWCAPNPRVRMQANWTMGRKKPGAVTAREGGDCSGGAEGMKTGPMEKPN